MNPYYYIRQATENGESLLSLCCGIGLELSGLDTKEVTAVDIFQGYLDQVKDRCPQATTVRSDALEYVKEQPDNSFDVVSIVDGIEHMPKEVGLKLIPEMKRICKKQVLLFTPQGHGEDGYLKNEPHNAWGVEGADEHQKHLSGWTVDELQDLGFEVIVTADDVSQHGDPYTALMMRYDKNV
jgi:ubiquinone/menaquinone biosynthesis C-methylase UbiE